MKRKAIAFLVAAAACIGLVAQLHATGRWKIGDTGCYWDPNDDGANQCTAGRWKIAGDGSCYGDTTDSGPNQCDAPMTTSVFNSYVSAADALNANITGTSNADIEAALVILDQNGLLPEALPDMSDVFGDLSTPLAGGCARRDAMYAKAQKATLWLGAATTGLGLAALVSAGFGAEPAAVGLAAGAVLTGGLGVAMGVLTNYIGNLQC